MTESITKRILLVEDEAILAMTEKMQLEKYGYAVRTVTTGEKAVEAVKSSSDIDLILMDINLGSGIDGTQAAEIILKDHDIPIVFLSSHTEFEVVEKTEKITSYGYVVKNSNITVLDASIKMAFRLFETRRLADDTFTHSINGLCVHRLIRDESGKLHDCEYLRVNGSFERHTGLVSRNIIGRTIRDLYPGSEADDVIRLYDEVLSGRADAQQEVYFEPTQGWYEISIFRTQEDEFTVVVHNITKRKRIEKELLRNRDLLERTQQLARIGGWVWDVEPQTMTWTDETYRIHGMTPGEFAPGTPEHIKASLACYDPADRGVIEAAFGLCAGDGQPYDLEFPLTRVDGSRIWIRTMADAEKHGDRVVRVFGNIIDITERKQAEEAVAQKTRLLEASQALADLGSWEWDIVHDTWYFSEQWRKIHGVFDDDFDTSKLMEIAHPEDAPHIKRAFSDATEQGKPYDIENRIIRVDNGEIRYVKALGEAEFDLDTGRPVRMMGAVQDITERKRAEEELRKSEERFRHMVNVAPLGIAITDSLTGEFFLVNPAMSRITGRSVEELERINWVSMTHPDDIQPDQEKMAEMNAGKISGFQLEKRFLHADGHYFWVNITVAPIDVTDNSKPRHLLMVEDITERKQAEKEIQKQLSEKELLLREVHHRVKNNMANVESLLSLQAASTAHAEAKATLQDAISRVQSMRVLYDKLLLGKDINEVSVKNYAEGLIDSLVMFFDPENTIRIEKQIVDFTIPAKQATTVGIILNELLTNVFKYAFRDRDNGILSVTINKEESEVSLIIQDNGAGFDERVVANESPGLGLTIVKMLVEQLAGTYSLSNDNGARSVVRFGI